MKRKIISLLALLVLTFNTVALAATGSWSELPMKYMSDNNYWDAGTDPDAYITRLDVAKILSKLSLIDMDSNYIFLDTSNSAVIKVAKAGLMNGIGNQMFAPEDFITREEVAKVFACLLTVGQCSDAMSFDDTADIGNWALPYVSALVRDKIVLGYGNNTFCPKNNVTYAEFAVLFMKIRDENAMSAITSNVAGNVKVMPVQYLTVPDGYVGVLSIPSLGLNELPVVEDGENLDNIKSVAGHFINTAIYDGNVGILGHDFVDKSPWFGKLANINVGDKVVWKTKFGIRRYSVSEKQNINAEDWSYLLPTDDNRISLVTCLAGQAQTTRILVQCAEMK